MTCRDPAPLMSQHAHTCNPYVSHPVLSTRYVMSKTLGTKFDFILPGCGVLWKQIELPGICMPATRQSVGLHLHTPPPSSTSMPHIHLMAFAFHTSGEPSTSVAYLQDKHAPPQCCTELHDASTIPPLMPCSTLPEGRISLILSARLPPFFSRSLTYTTIRTQNVP